MEEPKTNIEIVQKEDGKFVWKRLNAKGEVEFESLNFGSKEEAEADAELDINGTHEAGVESPAEEVAEESAEAPVEEAEAGSDDAPVAADEPAPSEESVA